MMGFIRMHHACNQVRRKLHKAHQEGKEGLKGKRMERRCARAFSLLHFQSKCMRVIIHQRSSRVLSTPEYYYDRLNCVSLRGRKKEGKEREKISGNVRKASEKCTWCGAYACGKASRAINALRHSHGAERASLLSLQDAISSFL